MKIRIKWANTPTLQVIYGGLDWPQRCALFDYIDELRTQARWDAENVNANPN